MRLDTGSRAKTCLTCKHINKAIKQTTPGSSGTRLYRVYTGMLGRCYSKSNGSYAHYGSKGITVCGEWRNSFEVFRNWALSNGYTDSKVLDKDTLSKGTKIYSPTTCTFLSLTTNASIKQSHNTSGYVGVGLDKSTGKFKANITVKGVYNYLGLFNTIAKAVFARNLFITNNKLDYLIQ